MRAPLLLGIVLAVMVVSSVTGFEANTRSTTMVQPTTIVKVTTKPVYVSGSNVTTLTEYVVIEGEVHATYVVSSTCTIAPPTVWVNLTTTTYLEPTNIISYFNATITTINSYTFLGMENFTTTISDASNNTSNTSSRCPQLG